MEPLLVFARLLAAVPDGDLSLSRFTAADGEEPPVVAPVLPVAGAGVPLADWGSAKLEMGGGIKLTHKN